MALTFWKWLAVGVVGCSAVWMGVLHQPSFADHAVGAREQPAKVAFAPSATKLITSALAQTNDRLRLLELRDSVMAKRPLATSNGLSITFDSSFGADTRSRVESALRGRWKSLGAGDRVPVAIALVTDSGRSNHDLPRSRTFSSVPIEVFLPSAATRGTCVALVHLPYPVDLEHDEFSRQSRGNLFSRETIEAELSPCAFYASFGNPGALVRRWLLTNRWSQMRLAAWDSTPAPWRSTVTAHFYARGFTDALMINADPAWEIRRYVAPSGIACLAGEDGTCGKVMLGSSRSPSDSMWRESVVSSGGTNRFSFYLPQDVPPLGPSVGLVLSEMVRTLGPEEFQKFWQSAAPVDQAFQQATGTSMDAWTHRWMTGMYGAATVGPSLAAPGLVAGLAVLVIGFLVGCVLAERRTVM